MKQPIFLIERAFEHVSAHCRSLTLVPFSQTGNLGSAGGRPGIPRRAEHHWPDQVHQGVRGNARALRIRSLDMNLRDGSNVHIVVEGSTTAMTDDIAPTEVESEAATGPKSSADRVRAFHERQRASGHERRSFYLTQQEVDCLNDLVRQFGWSRSTVVGAALRAVWKHNVVNPNKGDAPR
jgi:hypothetical protein